MKTRNLAIAIALVGLIVTGVLIAQSTTETADTETEYEWDMISQNVAGTGGSSAGQATESSAGEPVHGTVFLFNKRTGKVYRYWADCGDDAPHGCLDPLPVFGLDPTYTLTPTPTSGSQGYQRR